MIRQVESADELVWRGRPLVVCFTNPETCAPCRLLSPHYASVASSSLNSRVVFLEVNVLEHMDIAIEHGVGGTPTVLFIGEGGSVPISARTAPFLDSEIRSHLE